MPKIVVVANSGGAINTASNAHHYRFVGIEFKPVANNFMYNIISIGNGETSASTLPNNLVFDRCYIHGDPVAGSRRGVLMNEYQYSEYLSIKSDLEKNSDRVDLLFDVNSIVVVPYGFHESFSAIVENLINKKVTGKVAGVQIGTVKEIFILEKEAYERIKK